MATVPLSMRTSLDAVLARLGFKGKSQSGRSALLLGILSLLVFPFDVEHLITMFIGALAYLLFYILHPTVKVRGTIGPNRNNPSAESGRTHIVQRILKPKESGSEARTCAVSPVVAPKFHGSSWEEEVNELLDQITPSADCEQKVAHLTRTVKTAIWSTFPGVEVMGFASNKLESATKAFGVAVPDVDIVVNVSPETVMQRLQQRNRGRARDSKHIDARHVQKYAIRLCTDRLVSATNLKFRRSAFTGNEPKVTLLAPAAPGFSDHSVPMDFSVNSLTPLHSAALLTECGKIDSRARALILLVKRWAKDRGISHAAKGHLSPYAWTLLVIYFLQVGVEDDGPVLPPLNGFEVSSGLLMKADNKASTRTWLPTPRSKALKSVASIFQDFFRFYNTSFDWRSEGVDIKAGTRAPPSLSMPLHIIDDETNCVTEVGPSIEDPFVRGQNLSTGMSAWSLSRMFQEVKRADDLCTNNVSLAVLLEPWVPLDLASRDWPVEPSKGER